MPFAERPDAGRELVTLDGRYHVLERIATGGMGEVFRARDLVLEREVAIKVLHRNLAADPGFVERFRREARAAASLNHPNIVAVYDWGAVDGVYFMVMEHVRGPSLREVLDAAGRLEPRQAADVLLQVLAALDHAHRMGIVHRDVKPENILVTPEGTAKVADFGLARAYADARSTQTGSVAGTVQYLAPEQLRGEPADPRTDLYSVGIVGFELLTGRTPFAGETPMAVAQQHLTRRVPRPSSLVPGIPRELDGFILSATERDRELRPASAAEMRRDLEREAARLPDAPPLGELVGAVPAEGARPAARATTVRVPRRARRRRVRRIAGALVAVLAVAAGAWAAWTWLVPHPVRVPDVVGEPVARAERALERLGFVVRVAEGAYAPVAREDVGFEPAVPAGAVLRLEPGPGTELEPGSRVVLVPSLGGRPVPVPDVVGLTPREAREELAGSRLELAVAGRVYDERVPAGRIAAQRPTGGRLPQGEPVVVRLSKGPPPVPVPDLVGRPRDEAVAELRAAGLEPRVVERFSDAVDRGYVISQRPPAGSEAPRGSVVRLVVSKGPQRFPVPSYIGMSEEAAVAAIRADGLVPNVVNLPTVTGNVVSQEPVPGTTVRAGDTVTVYVA
ncbi:MAG TPA: Stk1 family PASTA domain-containing Ser/Thr kinase [Actinomycetota bacterium]|nr:Stk1 family PASTA domain-containing Ser/Thr kinase [Actinomycetota bacterium]